MNHVIFAAALVLGVAALPALGDAAEKHADKRTTV